MSNKRVRRAVIAVGASVAMAGVGVGADGGNRQHRDAGGDGVAETSLSVVAIQEGRGVTGRHVLTMVAPSTTLAGLVRTVADTDALGGPEGEIETQVRGSSGFLRGEFIAGSEAFAALERDLSAISAEHRAARWIVHRHDRRPRILDRHPEGR